MGKSRKRSVRLSGIALSLNLSEWSRLQLRANMKSRFPKASTGKLDDHVYAHLCELEQIRRRAVVRLQRMVAPVLRAGGRQVRVWTIEESP